MALAVGLAALVGLALAPALTGSASAAPAIQASATTNATTQWAYGGQGYSNGTTTIGGSTLTWHAAFGWTVVFTETNTSNSTVLLEEQRTVGVNLSASFAAPNVSASYTYFGSASDTAFVNLTDNATVDSAGVAVPALGIANESLSARSTVREAMLVANAGRGHSAYFNVTGTADAEIAFAPALGLLPLNLSATPHWTATANATPSANWSFAYAWSDHGWNGTVGSGSGSSAGNWTTTGPVYLSGSVVGSHYPYRNLVPRAAVVLAIQGPVDAYDGFVLVPHGFDLFGGAVHGFDRDGFGSASVGYGASETLFVTSSARGPIVRAAATSFAATDGTFSGLGPAPLGAAPAASSSTAPGGTVYAQPMSVAAAQAQADCLQGACPATGGATLLGGGLLAVGVIALAVVAIAGTGTALAWRARSRRAAAPPAAPEPAASALEPPRPPSA